MEVEQKKTHFSFSNGIDRERNEYVGEQLKAYNAPYTATRVPNLEELPVAQPREIYVLDEKQAVVGGLVGRTHSIWTWLEITVLWVDEAMRGRGLGRQLVEEAEREAVRRGCRYTRLATSDFQAPGFYEHMGYTVYGKLDNCPPGTTVYYFCKTLAEQHVPLAP